MPFPTSYTGWIAYVRDWLSADEYSEAQIASFLDLAQLRLNREMESYGMEADTTIILATDTPIVLLTAIPDFNKIRMVSYSGVGPLDPSNLNEVKKLLEENPGGSFPDGQEPKKYAIDAGKLYTFPATSAAGELDIFYYKRIPYLSTTPPVPSNVFSEDHPDALLYASLLAASPYMKDHEDIEAWSSAYLSALSTANSDIYKIKLGSTPLKREIKIS